MCRHFAWLGQPRSARELIFAPSYGLLRQAARPRWQREEVINLDGHGAGWFPAGHHDDGPKRFRRATAIGSDDFLRGALHGQASSCVVGAVRGASPGMPIEESATAPFSDGEHLMCHNGHVSVPLIEHLLPEGSEPESACDSAVLATILWGRLGITDDLTEAVADLLDELIDLDPNACLNLLVTDGYTIVATTWGETLCYRRETTGVIVASEPLDDEPNWHTVADNMIITVSGGRVTEEFLRRSTHRAPDEYSASA